jgi:hypothetical protein
MEALVIVLVFAVSAIIFGVTWFTTTYGPARNPAEELRQLESYREELRAKRLRGQHENWDHVMMGQIAGKLDEVERQIAETAGRA